MLRYALTVCLLVLWSASAHADKYYCMVFAWDSKIPMPNKTHTWGTFAQVDDDGKLVKEVTLSWAPTTDWKVPDRPVAGYHMSLKDTMDFAANRKWTIRVWGPYQISEEFFQDGVSQYERKDMQYKLIDGRSRRISDGKVVNCIHCLSDTAGHHRTWIKWGHWASASVVKHFDKQGLIARIEDDEKKKVLRAVGIDGYDMIAKR